MMIILNAIVAKNNINCSNASDTSISLLLSDLRDQKTKSETITKKKRSKRLLFITNFEKCIRSHTKYRGEIEERHETYVNASIFISIVKDFFRTVLGIHKRNYCQCYCRKCRKKYG